MPPGSVSALWRRPRGAGVRRTGKSQGTLLDADADRVKTPPSRDTAGTMARQASEQHIRSARQPKKLTSAASPKSQ